MPAAWELLEIRRNRVLMVSICAPDARVTRDWARMLRRLELPPSSAIQDVDGLPYHAARNLGAKIALDGDFGYLFFLDADTLPLHDMVTKLIATGRDLVGGMYFRRFPPYDPSSGMAVVDATGKVGVSTNLPPHSPGDILPVDFLSDGATLISRRCLLEMFRNFPRPFDWGYDIAPVPDIGGGTIPAFSEDFIFSYRAKQVGFQPWLHTGLRCGHELNMVVTTLGPKTPQEYRDKYVGY